MRADQPDVLVELLTIEPAAVGLVVAVGLVIIISCYLFEFVRLMTTLHASRGDESRYNWRDASLTVSGLSHGLQRKM